jgi:hypothetical protein
MTALCMHTLYPAGRSGRYSNERVTRRRRATPERAGVYLFIELVNTYHGVTPKPYFTVMLVLLYAMCRVK